ncbi:MAG: hypothetical protein H8F28_06655 [Fibrella sp.]|nr:hypothetical protein [Armatimonadota bacterium]
MSTLAQPALRPGKFQDAAFVQLIARPFSVKRPAAVEVLTLLILCAVDMYSTIYWVKTGQATEANPLLAWTFDVHPLIFVLIKTGTFLPTLILAAYMARKHPRTVTLLLRAVILAYIGIYLVGVFR